MTLAYICIYAGAATLAWCFIKFVEVIDYADDAAD